MKTTIPVRILLLSVCALVWPSVSLAMRCGNNLVDVGDTKIEVLAKCGEPALKEDIGDDFTTENDSLGRRKERRYVEQWTYNFGSTRFIYVITIRNGKVIDIRTLDKGF